MRADASACIFLRRNVGKYFQQGRKSGIINICKNIWKGLKNGNKKTDKGRVTGFRETERLQD